MSGNQDDHITPPGENLRRAVQWLSEQPRHDPSTVERASQLFDLSPVEEQFLMRHFLWTDS